jgi:UDP-N-acetylenolpyruvoylglucosamine reductase
MKQKVFDKFGVMLEEEVIHLGPFTKEDTAY